MMQIREVKSQDYRELCQLINDELGYPNVGLEGLEKRMEKMKKADGYETFVAIIDNKVVGFIGTLKCIAFEDDAEYLRVIALAVSNGYKRQGIGSALLKYVEEYALSQGMGDINLNSGFKRVEAHSFYERNGYWKKGFSFRKDLTPKII